MYILCILYILYIPNVIHQYDLDRQDRNSSARLGLASLGRGIEASRTSCCGFEARSVWDTGGLDLHRKIGELSIASKSIKQQ